MLPKSERLTQEDFKKIRPRVVFRGELFDVACVPSIITKFACVISKKTIAKSVDRNKAKRRILNTLENVTLPRPHSIIFYPKKIIHTAPYITLRKEIEKFFITLH